MRFNLHLTLPILLLTTLLGCESEQQTGDGPTPAASAKPAVQVVVRAVAVQGVIERRAAAGKDDGESFTALEGQTYAVVTADLAHNDCKDGDTVDSRHASLVMPSGKKIDGTGGGPDIKHLCVLCEANQPLKCRGGVAPLGPFTFVFSVPEKADVSKAKLVYQAQSADLSVVTLIDRRGNAALDSQIQEKRDEVTKLQKKLENTGSKSAGERILEDIDRLKGEIKKLEAKRK